MQAAVSFSARIRFTSTLIADQLREGTTVPEKNVSVSFTGYSGMRAITDMAVRS